MPWLKPPPQLRQAKTSITAVTCTIGRRRARLALGHRRRRREAALTAEYDAATSHLIEALDNQHGRSASRHTGRCFASPGHAAPRPGHELLIRLCALAQLLPLRGIMAADHGVAGA